VIQQRGGTGGDGDPEHAADAAAAAIVGRQPVPRQPAAAVGVACFQGAVQPTTTVTYGTGGAVSHNAPAIGQQNANASKGVDLSRGADERDLKGELLQKKYQLEQPKPTTAYGGAAPYFITTGEPKTLVVSGSDGRDQRNSPHGQQRNLPIVYKPHSFHVLSSIIHDLLRARTVDEILSIWSAYLADKPQAPPWSLRPKAEPQNPWAIETCKVDGPGYWEPVKLTLPAGSPMDPQAFVVVRVGDDIDDLVSWPSRLTPFPEDSSGAARIGILTLMIETMADADVIPGLMEMVRPHKKRKAKIDTQDAPTADPASTTATRPADPAADNGPRRRPIPTLVLPQGKARHLGVYQNLAASRMLVHEKEYERGKDKQDRKWDAAMKHDGSVGIPETVWNEGKQLLTQLGRKYKPAHRGVYRPDDWSRSKLTAEMQVDHIVELQLVTQGDRGWADDIGNYELLEAAANRSSGSLLKEAVKKEREDLFAETGDRKYLDQPLAFERVILGDKGITGEHWTPEEVRAGEHLDTLRASVVADAFPDGMDDLGGGIW